jgi:hypothetical protein
MAFGCCNTPYLLRDSVCRVFAHQEQMHREWHFVGMDGTPRNDPFQLQGIVGDGADLDQFFLNGL